MTEEYRWLIYMAGDNDLSDRVNADLQEIQNGRRFMYGSSVAILADRSKRETEEIVLDSRGLKTAVRRGINENAGLASTLTGFLKRNKNGAKHHVACIWGHGYGWLNTAFADAEDLETPLRNSRKAMMVASRGLFRKPVVETLRAAEQQSDFDESSRDFLDMSELRTGLQLSLDPNDKYAIIGCDACYMAMLEVAYELRDEGKFLVASEEEEEPGGWDYSGLFQKLKPGMSPKQVAKTMVSVYRPQTLQEPRATLSAIKLAEMDELADAVDALGAVLTPLIGTYQFDAIKKARAEVHTFKLYHYIDLLHFAQCLQAQFPKDNAIEDAADDVIKAVQGAVVATMNGVLAANAHGIAVYLPNEPVNPNYENLAIVRDAPKWAEFVRTYGENR